MDQRASWSLRAPWLLGLCSALLVVIAIGGLLDLGADPHPSTQAGALDPAPVKPKPKPDPGAGPVEVDGKPLLGCVPAGATHVFNGTGKRIALTFDDGPSPDTVKIMDILKRKKAKATFFENGRNFRGRKSIMRRVLAEGHSLANHTYYHGDISAATPKVMSDIRLNDKEMFALTGYKPCLFRAPYGATSPEALRKVRKLGMLAIRWDVDTRDFAGASAVAIANEAVRSAKAGSIVLMHDGPPEANRTPTVEALPGIIDRLRARGYDLVTVEELLGLQRRYGKPAARRYVIRANARAT